MIEVEAVARKWGNSIGIALPKDVIKKAKIKADKKVTLYIPERIMTARKIFGSCPMGEKTQDILDDIRKGED